MTDKKLMELLVVIDDHYGRIRSKEERMDELNPTIKERQIYHEMKLTPAMVKSIRTLCGVCLRHYVETKAFKIAIVPNKDRCMETCTVCQTRRGYDYVVMPR